MSTEQENYERAWHERRNGETRAMMAAIRNVPITLLRNGDQIRIGFGDNAKWVRVTGLREKENGTGYVISAVDVDGNRSEHRYMPLDPNRHRFDVRHRPDPQTWDGTTVGSG